MKHTTEYLISKIREELNFKGVSLVYTTDKDIINICLQKELKRLKGGNK